ncbi:MAG TPA: methyltransferase domain-containing protein [Candidatus Binataceae bacterium]|nr:methyltransferase domain-containing protein [Candidatus Binataceae bacterium]
MANAYYKQHWVEVEPERQGAYDEILAYHPALDPLLQPLEPGLGMRLLDVGSGPGYTALEMARRVGASGRVVGVDINADFVAAASRRARAQGLNAEFVQAAVPPLPFPDRSFERVLCKNVLEYVDSAADTMAEMARVAASGAIVVAIDSDWEMLALELAPRAQALSDRVIAAARAIAVNEPRIGRRLHGLMRRAGLDEVKVSVFASADTRGHLAVMLRQSLARYARDSGAVSAAEVERWLGAVDEAIAAGEYLFMLPQFVARGMKR